MTRLSRLTTKCTKQRVAASVVWGFVSVTTLNANADTGLPTVKAINGHQLLRTHMKDDTYAMGRLATNLVVAKIENGKVVDMSAGGLPMKRVKVLTPDPSVLRDGYCFAAQSEFTCYWYAPNDVIEDSSWYEYDPNYADASPDLVAGLD